MSRVKGFGPLPCDFFVCGEKPGWQEHAKGIPLVGKTGAETKRFFNGRDLPALDDCFRTNLLREFVDDKYDYTAEDYARDEPELLEELRRCQPAVIVALGRAAVRYFMGDVDMEDVWGFPWILPTNPKFDFLKPGTVVYPVHHPAQGFHSPEASSLVVAGFGELARFVDGQVEARQLYDDPYPTPVYEEITTVARLQAVLAAYDGSPIGVDSEGSAESPWSYQISWVPGTAYVVVASNQSVCRALAGFIRRAKPRLIFHSSLHDLTVFRRLQLDLCCEGIAFDDTMIAAYLLQLEPQGLKSLCVRHCNMEMQSYMGVIGEAADRVARDYLVWVWEGEQDAYEERCRVALATINATPLRDQRGHVKTDKSGLVKYRRCSKPPQLPKTALHKAAKRCLGAKDARKNWDHQIEDIHVAAYQQLGTMPDATLDLVPRREAVQYGGRDADGTVRLAPELRRRVSALGLDRTYALELATYPLIDRMQHVGIKPDLAHFADLSVTLGGEIETLQRELVMLSGRSDFNANSGDQVATHLFDELGLESLKRTSGGRGSTNDKILEGLERAYPAIPVIASIRSYRELYKLKHTFVDRIPDFVQRWPGDGRIHATFRTTRVVTGRLAASDPNLLAMPKYGKFASAFRRGFVAGEGHVLGSWDLSQIELRILAHLSQDPLLLKVFRGELRNPDGSKIDLHAAMAQRIFGIAPRDQKKQHRLAAKAINFGIPMGMTNVGLTVQLRKEGVQVNEDDAQRWLDDSNKLYAKVPDYKSRMIAQARRDGYIRCLSGRIRYIGGIHSSNERIQEEAQRFAFSTPIQEGAQLIAKTAEAHLWQHILLPLWKRKVWVEPILQIHDDLILEAEPSVLFELDEMMVDAMTKVPAHLLSVPIETSGDYGENWADMTPIRL